MANRGPLSGPTRWPGMDQAAARHTVRGQRGWCALGVSHGALTGGFKEDKVLRQGLREHHHGTGHPPASLKQKGEVAERGLHRMTEISLVLVSIQGGLWQLGTSLELTKDMGEVREGLNPKDRGPCTQA
jgi:hypothetical protein